MEVPGPQHLPNGSRSICHRTEEIPLKQHSEPDFCPYLGLDPFGTTHAKYFFGRSRDSKIISDHIRARPITILYGASGVGKSSVVNVGIPAAIAQRSSWTIAWMSDWRNPERLERISVKAVLGQLSR